MSTAKSIVPLTGGGGVFEHGEHAFQHTVSNVASPFTVIILFVNWPVVNTHGSPGVNDSSSTNAPTVYLNSCGPAGINNDAVYILSPSKSDIGLHAPQ